MAYERLAIVNCLYTSKTEGYAQLVNMSNVKYSQTISNCLVTIYIKKNLENSNSAPKGNLSIKVLTSNLTQPIQASPLPSNDFYK